MNKFYTQEERDQIIKDHMHLVPKVAFKYKDLMPMNELNAAGNLGLIRGVDKYDPTKGFKVSTYVVSWIRAEILSALYENRNVHIPWNKINSALKRRDDSDPQNTSDLKSEDLIKVEFSLDRPSKNMSPFSATSDSGDDEPFSRNKWEMNTSLSAETVADIDAADLRQHISIAMDSASLSNNEKLSLVYRFGLDGEAPKSLQQVADTLNYSRMGAHLLQKRALKKLKNSKLIEELIS